MKIREALKFPDVHRCILLLLCAAVFLSILGARWKMVELYGTDVPEWDEWQGFGFDVFKPWFEHGNIWKGLLAPQNEHRVIVMKTTHLGLMLANGQWDQKLEAAANAFYPAALGAALLFWLRSYVPKWVLPLFAVLIAALWGLPISWHNSFGGYHGGQVQIPAFTFVAIATLGIAEVGKSRFWVGVFFCLLLMATMGSGFLAASTVGGMCLLSWLFRGKPLAQWLPVFLFCVILTIFGFYTRVVVDYHDFLRAKTFADFAGACLHILEWPLLKFWWAPFIFWTPWLWLTVLWLLRRSEPARDNRALVLLGLGTWLMLQVVATGAIRGAGAPYPASRYMDIFVLGAFVNAASLAWLLTGNPSRLTKTVAGVLSLAWVAGLSAGLYLETRHILKAEIAHIPGHHRDCEQNSRAYLRTKNINYLVPGRIPYPEQTFLKGYYDTPTFAMLMPSSIRLPFVDLQPLKSDGFYSPVLPPNDQVLGKDTHDGLPGNVQALGPEPIWTSFGTEGALTKGQWVSRPFRSPEPYMRLEMAGTHKDPDVKVELRSATTGEVIETIHPHHRTLQEFQPVFIHVPDQPVFLQATDTSSTGWVAFSSPTAVPRISYLTKIFIHEGWNMIYVSALLWLGAVALSVRFKAKNEPAV